MKTTKRYSIIARILLNITISALFILLGGCDNIFFHTETTQSRTIGDIAYNKSKQNENIFYIKEGDALKPYIVLSSDYGEGVLLLRKYLLDDTRPFNNNDAHMWSSSDNAGYYEDSSIDKYLNENFVQNLDSAIQKYIIDSDVTITAKSSLGITGDETIKITRKIFLLSTKELNAPDSRASAAEGDLLGYFKDDYNRRVACFSNGEECPYWTRTPETWETYTVFTIGEAGLGSASADIQSGVRPAFCLNASTPITQITDADSDRKVYVLDYEK